MGSSKQRLRKSSNPDLRRQTGVAYLKNGIIINKTMKCPYCQSQKTHKYGRQRGKQRFKCNLCKRQFVEVLTPLGYKENIKEQCLKMYLNGIGFRAIQRIMGVHHTTIIKWVKELGKKAEKEYNEDGGQEIPEITQIDELQTFIGKKNKIWIWTAANKHKPGILEFVIGDRSSKTFKNLWRKIRGWKSFFM